jgi:cell wall-associated NlpC family hydrolase
MKQLQSRMFFTVRCATIVIFVSAFFASLGCAPKKIIINESSPAMASLKDSIVEYAITQIGKPYRNGAKGPNAFDCSGFVQYVYGRFNTILPPSTDGLVKLGYEIPRYEIEPGDMVFFSIKNEMHVGIIINPLEFVHSSKSRGVAIDSLDLPYWRRGFSHFRRIL